MEIKSTDSLENRRSLLQPLVDKRYKGGGKSGSGPAIGEVWIKDMFPTYVIVERKGQTFAHRYSIKKGKPTVGPAVEVETIYRSKGKAGGRSASEDWEKMLKEA